MKLENLKSFRKAIALKRSIILIQNIKNADSQKDKLKILVCAFGILFRFSFLFKIMPVLLDKFIKNTVIKVDQIKYLILDIDSMTMADKDYEKWVWDYLKVKDGETFIDVGAHIGKYTLTIATKNKHSQVYAIEANPICCEALAYASDLNHLDNVSIFNVAAYDEPTAKHLYKARGLGGWTLKGQFIEGLKDGLVVNAVPLDYYFGKMNNIKWIKIDVEGSELEALLGLRETIKRNRPNIILESWDKCFSQVRHLLESMYSYSLTKIHSEYYLAQPGDWKDG